jgi:hypothetical protein
MTRMADQSGTPGPVAGATAAPELAARTGTWRIGLAALALAAVVAGLAASVVSASGEPRPPDLGGPILARGAVTTSAPTPPQAPSASPAPRAPTAVYSRTDGQGRTIVSAAAPVPIRPVPVTAVPGRALPSTTAALPAPAPPTTQAPADRSAP